MENMTALSKEYGVWVLKGELIVWCPILHLAFF
jgi:hypothetical protein